MDDHNWGKDRFLAVCYKVGMLKGCKVLTAKPGLSTRL
jgi:hypothetical protein